MRRRLMVGLITSGMPARSQLMCLGKTLWLPVSVSGSVSQFWHVLAKAVAGPWSLAGRNRSLRVAVAAAAACGTALSMPGHGIHTASREICHECYSAFRYTARTA